MIRKVRAVGVIFENEYGQILVLKRHPQSHEGATWGLVGGKVEKSEDEVTAARREVREEIGHSIDLPQLKFFKNYHWKREDLDVDFTVFVLSIQTNKITLDIDQNEHTEHLWASPQDLYKRKDLMQGLYPILQDRYSVRE